MITIPWQSRCDVKSQILCDLRIVKETDKVLIEECRFCHRPTRFNKDEKGRVDSKEYGKWHLRDILQPYGNMLPLYRKIYGDASLERVKEHIEKKRKQKSGYDRQELQEYARETLKTNQRLDSQAKL